MSEPTEKQVADYRDKYGPPVPPADIGEPEASRRPVVRGTVFVWDDVVRCKVQRVAKDGTWADMRCTQGGSSWGRRMKLPLAEVFVRKN